MSKEEEEILEDNVTIIKVYCLHCAHAIKIPVYLPPNVVKEPENIKPFLDYYVQHFMAINTAHGGGVER